MRKRAAAFLCVRSCQRLLGFKGAKPVLFARWGSSSAPFLGYSGTFFRKDLVIEKCTPDQLQQKPDWDHLTFGHHFSDHMLELFEGVKAYRGVDNRIRIFRPDLNMKRMLRTAQRACLPMFEGEELLLCMDELVKLDQDWVPDTTTSSLYIRPTFIGTDPHIGIGPSESALLFMISGPVGAYFPTGLKPISLLANPTFVRAFPGGTGDTKLGCNYAPTILIAKTAQDEGCQQVLWLFGKDEQLTEVGTMNIFVLWINENGEKELVTPPLESGLILPGVTRESILELTKETDEFKEWFKVSERVITMDEVKKALHEDRLLEMFGTGTACIVSPVDRILYKKGDKSEELYIPTMEQNPCLMQRLFDILNDIQPSYSY